MRTVAEQSARVRALEAGDTASLNNSEANAPQRGRSAMIDSKIKGAWAWALANPKPTLIGVAVALAFNFVLYPLMHETCILFRRR